MCGGASSSEKRLMEQQTAFYKELTANYAEQFGAQSAILKTLTSSFEPILEAGIGQEGFTPEELTAMKTQATEGTAGEYSKALQAVQGQRAAAGGGNAYLPSGQDDVIRGQIATAAAQQQSSALNQITAANYAQGRANYAMAANALGGAAGMYNPIGYIGGTNQAGSSAFSSANTINQEENSRLGGILGLVGGVAAGALTGGLGGGGFTGALKGAAGGI